MSPATIARLNTEYHHCLRREVRQERRIDKARPAEDRDWERGKRSAMQLFAVMLVVAAVAGVVG